MSQDPSKYFKMIDVDAVNAAEIVNPSTKFEFGDMIIGQLAYDDELPSFNANPGNDFSFSATVGFVKDNQITTVAVALSQVPIVAMTAIYFDGFYEIKDNASGKVLTHPRYKTTMINPKFPKLPYLYIVKKLPIKSL